MLDRWVFCEQSRQARRRGDDWQVRKESGAKISTTTFGFSARAVLNTPPLGEGIFIIYQVVHFKFIKNFKLFWIINLMLR